MNAAPIEADLYFSTLTNDADLAEIVELFVMELPERLLKLSDAAEAGDWHHVGHPGPSAQRGRRQPRLCPTDSGGSLLEPHCQGRSAGSDSRPAA